MDTFRLRERVTIEEEEALVDRIVTLFDIAYAISARKKIFETLDGLMNTRGAMKDEDLVHVGYSQSVNVEHIKIMLYEIRRGASPSGKKKGKDTKNENKVV
jgi:hypothetical protein